MISVGQIVGNYKVTAKLGEGGMGVVFLAEHPVIGRKVALKVIHAELSRNPEVISRFMTEAKSVNQIGNEHIVDINDFGNTSEGDFYFVMEFLQGEALADRMKREHSLAMARALKIGAQVADALAASHDHGIIHRDLKPENVYLITRGSNHDFVKVLDFGLAKLTQGDEKVSHKTRTGSVMGTPYYMSPEQCEGKASVDHRADVYSLGIILFEMMTGKVPFGGEGYGEIIVKHITQAPPSPRAINPLIEEAHEAILMRAMAKNRDERFQNMADFRAAMLDPQGYLANTPLATPSESQAEMAQVRATNAATLGAVSKPVPTTFRHGAGEIGDDLDELPKSRKGLMFGIGGGVVAAIVIAVMLMRGGGSSENETLTGAATAPAPTPTPVPPPEPDKVKITFESDPQGATVKLTASGEVLGTAPLEKEFPRGKTAVQVSFALAGYQTKTDSFVPDEASKLLAGLEKAVETHPVTAKVPDRVATDRSGKDKPRNTGTKPKGKGKRNAVLDEDAVLEPNFN